MCAPSESFQANLLSFAMNGELSRERLSRYLQLIELCLNYVLEAIRGATQLANQFKPSRKFTDKLSVLPMSALLLGKLARVVSILPIHDVSV